MRFSKIAFFLCAILLFVAQFIYYPKWKFGGTEATLSWDVSGYYFYLPAAFIYQDLDEVAFRDSVIEKYNPTTSPYQAFDIPNGNRAMKYSMGQAVSFLPGFLAGHVVASISSYPADGFSRPYQMAIAIWSIIVAIIGLLALRKVLLRYFSDIATGIALLVIVFATNYMNYAGIDSAMTHNYLFTIYALLMLVTIRFYEQPNFRSAIFIGLLIGLAALTRPTDLLAVMVPIAWGVWNWKDVKERLALFAKKWKYLLTAAVACIALGSLQLIYWKLVTGHFIFYSYEDQGFSWLDPYFRVGIFGYQSGWLIYSPAIFFALVGFLVLLLKKSKVTWATGITTALAIYIVFSWDDYLYGGSLGSRAMVQYYALMALPLAAFTEWIWKKSWLKWLYVAVVLVISYYNIWLTHQAHRGGYLPVGQLTKAYFWETVGRWNLERDVYKLLDHNERYTGELSGVDTIQQFNLKDVDSSYYCKRELPANFGQAICLDDKRQYSPEFSTSIDPNNGQWLRSVANVYLTEKEWNRWLMTQFVVRFYNAENEEIKGAMIKIDRLLDQGEVAPIWIDTRIPPEADHVKVYFWNAGSQRKIAIGSITLLQFSES